MVMVTVQPLSSLPKYSAGPMIQIPFTIDPTKDFPSQTLAPGTPVVRPSDGCQWTVASSFPWPGWNDRICLVLSLVTPPTNPVQIIKLTDTLNIG
jgi:hypothetical protein